MRLAGPNQIWVYDFIADPARIPADTSCELLPGWREQSHDGAKADVVTELFVSTHRQEQRLEHD